MTLRLARPVGSRVVVVVGLAVVAGSLTVAGNPSPNVGGLASLRSFFVAAVRPDLSPDLLGVVAEAAAVTVLYAAAGAGVGVLAGFFLSLVSADALRSSPHLRATTLVRRLIRWSVAIPRGLHEVLVALLLINIFGADPLVAVVGIAFPFAAITARVYANALDESGSRQLYQQLRASGASRLSALSFTAVPNASADLLSYGFYRFECAIRSAAVLGYIGLGGLGFQLSLSSASLRYNEVWTIIYGLMMVAGVFEAWSRFVQKGLRAGSARRLLARGSVIALLVMAGISTVWLGLRLVVIVDVDTAARANAIVLDLVSPRFSLALLWASVQTVALATIAALLAAFGATVITLAAVEYPGAGGSSVMFRLVAATAGRFALLGLRTIPPPLWVFLVLLVVRPGLWPGAVALGLYNLGILARLQTEVVDNEPLLLFHQLISTGATRTQAIFWGVVPKVGARFLGLVLYRWEVAIRDTVLVGAVGVAGLGRLLRDQIAARDYTQMAGTLVVFVVLTVVADRLSASIRGLVRAG